MKISNKHKRIKNIIGPMLGLTAILAASTPIIVSCSDSQQETVEKFTGNQFDITLEAQLNKNQITNFYGAIQYKFMIIMLL